MPAINYLTKQLATTSSTGLGSISTAAVSVITFNTSVIGLGTGQRIEIFSTAAADASSLKVTITGYTNKSSLTLVTETLSGSTANGVVTSTGNLSYSDFTQITAISISSNAQNPISIGLSSIGGTVWQSANYQSLAPLSIAGELTLSSSANSMSGGFEFIFDDPWLAKDPFQSIPTVYKTTTGMSSAASNTAGPVNVLNGFYVPIAAYRLTITSSSSGAGTINATVIQSGR